MNNNLKTLKDIENETIIIGEPNPRARDELPVHSSYLRDVAKEWVEAFSRDRLSFDDLPDWTYKRGGMNPDHYDDVVIWIKHFFNLE
jgi:hypothetical protein